MVMLFPLANECVQNMTISELQNPRYLHENISQGHKVSVLKKKGY